MSRDNWNREQLIVALNLYWKIPYNKISGSSNTIIKEIASLIDRKPAALAYKLMNFTSLDAEKKKLGNKGKTAASASDKKIWNEYFGKWEELAHDSCKILSTFQNKSIENMLDFETDLKFAEGKEKDRIVKTRVNQSDFRQRILASYNEKCSITGISLRPLLVASHIIPWSKNKEDRLNPKNGICLNMLHDKAFDKGLITITFDFKVKLSDSVLRGKKDFTIQKYFLDYENKPIILPDRFLPAKEFLAYHHQNIFNK
ncbi:MAG: HNH endonuclease [Chitinophagaceae bacterium]|nr:HNH endonuclease [Chitinophagaceae bacterium]